MDKTKHDSDTDLQRGIEPLRTIFATVVLLLGFVAAARAESGPALAGEDRADGAMIARINVIHDERRDTTTRPSAQPGRSR